MFASQRPSELKRHLESGVLSRATFEFHPNGIGRCREPRSSLTPVWGDQQWEIHFSASLEPICLDPSGVSPNTSEWRVCIGSVGREGSQCWSGAQKNPEAGSRALGVISVRKEIVPQTCQRIDLSWRGLLRRSLRPPRRRIGVCGKLRNRLARLDWRPNPPCGSGIPGAWPSR